MKEQTRNVAARQIGILAILAGLCALWILLAQILADPPLRLQVWPAVLVALAITAGSGWVGWAVRQAWFFPATLQKAEVLWASGCPPEGVETLLNGALLARGELGYRIHLLRGRALLAQDRREEAWASFLHGELARLPFPVRWLVAPLFGRGSSREGRAGLAARMAAFAPRMAHLRHLEAALRMRQEDPGARRTGVDLLRDSVDLAEEDPLLLEDTMLAALQQEDLALAAKALAHLLARHADPRLPWNRAAGASILLRQDRPAEAAALAAAVPPGQRSGPEIWALEAAARRRLGDFEGAEAALDAGLERHPRDFRLWMESHALAMEDRAYDDAFSDLEEARGCLDPDDPAMTWEWELRQAEFAWWADGDAETAVEHLSKVPVERQGPEIPPLRMILRVATGGHAAVLGELEELETLHPRNVGVKLLHGECLAGLGAWESLASHLDAADEDLRQQPGYRHLRGVLCAHTNRLLEAREDMEKAAAMEPDNLRFLLDAGHACADLGEWERSESHWKRALDLEPGCEEALLELAEARLAVHDRAGAVRYLRECLNRHPEAQEAQLRLAELESH